MNKTVKLLLVIVSGILVGIMIYSAYNIIEDKVVHSEARSKDNQVVESYVIQNPVSPTPRVYEEQVTNQILLDDEVSPLNSMVDLSKFFADYKDAVAWIYSPDTKINYGVVEAEDNDFYLHRAMDGSYSISGSLFVDCNNKRDFSDENTVIYGHHMNDGTKFADIMYYKEQLPGKRLLRPAPRPVSQHPGHELPGGGLLRLPDRRGLRHLHLPLQQHTGICRVAPADAQPVRFPDGRDVEHQRPGHHPVHLLLRVHRRPLCGAGQAGSHSLTYECLRFAQGPRT